MTNRSTWPRWLVLFALFGWTSGAWLLACRVVVSDIGQGDGGPEDAGGTDARPESGPDASMTDGAAEANDASSGPSLTALAVMSGSDSILTLVPAFSPSITDYFIRCPSPSNTVSVSMTASPGSLSSLLQPTTSPRLPSQVLTVTVDENAAIVAGATLGTASLEYWVRCLPNDFPVVTVEAPPDAGAPTPGYYLVGTAVERVSAGYVMILDQNGVPVWYQSTFAPDFDVESLAPHALSYLTASPAGLPGAEFIEPGSADGGAASFFAVSTLGNELRILPSGHYLFITQPLETHVDLTGLTVPLPDGGSANCGANSEIVGCVLTEMEPGGSVAWTWNALDHFDPATDSTHPTLASGTTPKNGVVDTFHCDSIDVDPTSGDLLVSAAAMDSVFYVQRSTGKVLWKMGGDAFSKDGATFIPVADPFHGQHDARLQPGWSSCAGGQISLFDDQTYGSGPARAVVYDVQLGAQKACDGGGAGPGATVAWQFVGSGPSSDLGSFRVTADGSRVVGWGVSDGTALLTEVDLAGHDLLDFSFGAGTYSDRAIKVPLSTFDLSALRTSAGGM